MIEKEVNLIINKGLTKEQFEQAFADGLITEDELSFVNDDIYDNFMSDDSENGVQNKVIKAYIDSTEQDIITNYMQADTDLQTQITGLSSVVDEEQEKIIAIEGKIPTNASASNLLSTANDLLNATQDVRADFAEADSELQTQINGQATVIAGKQDKLVSGTNIKTINGESILGSGDLEIKSGGSGRNVGDIFYTTRLDTELNGAVECNGGTYNIGDFEGEQSIGNLLNAGSLPYVSFEEYSSIVSTNGSCRAFGWDGGTTFKVPTLNDVYIEAGNAESNGEFISESLPNITGNVNTGTRKTDAADEMSDGALYISEYGGKQNSYGGGANSYNYQLVNFDASRASSTYQDGAKVKPDSVRYRAMVQLANEATDEALITATSALQQIANKVDRSEADYVVETYQNGTEWYRVYKSGWVEQGGVVKKGSSLGNGDSWDRTITFLKPFENTNYSIKVIAGFGTSGDSVAGQEVKYKSKTENSIIISLYNRNSSTDMDANIEMTWEVKGA